MNFFTNLPQKLMKIVKFYYVKVKYLAINKYRQTIKVLIGFVKHYIFLLFSFMLILLFYYFIITIEKFDFSNILIALASIVATILALVFTLSLISIQNAVSMWSFSILSFVNRVSKDEYLKRNLLEEIEEIKIYAEKSKNFGTTKKCDEFLHEFAK